MADHEMEFKPKARLLLQLGDQLIRSESIALLEIIKNAYDANAARVDISMSNLENPAKGEITITDTGDGMDLDILKNVWMQPGSDYKVKLVDQHELLKEAGKRIPIGGKGIGRFGVHKLGFQIELTSKKADSKEVCLKIDWRNFEKDALLEDIKVYIEERDAPQFFLNGKTGTKIVIRNLKGTWTRGGVREVYRAINSLNPPFEGKGTFRAYFKLDNQEWLKGLLTFSDIENNALYFADAVIDGTEIKSLEYEFRPWDTMPKLEKHKLVQNDMRMVREDRDPATGKKKQVDIDLGKFKIGPVRFRILIFDRDAQLLSLGAIDKKGFKEYLDKNGGIRVFRDDIRVYDYGEPGNDWLNLDLMRVNQPGKTISNNIVIGAVGLDRLESDDLEEKTNREGFVENEAYKELWHAVRFTLDKILTLRNADKEQVRKYYSQTSVSEPVIGHLRSLHDRISEKVEDADLKKELLKSITEIEKDYQTISEIYTRSSSAGLSLSIVMHEIIHMISELSAAMEDKGIDQHIKNLVRTLQKTASDYAGVIKQSSKSKVTLSRVVSQAISNIQFRIKAHEVEIIRAYEGGPFVNEQVSCAQNLVISSIINIIDNSIWWQNYAKIEHKKIYIDIVSSPEKFISVLIADNGKGFTIHTEDAVKPFISDKPGGMGLGLHLANEVMNGQKGRLIFPDAYDFEIPEEFQKGAKIVLAFRRTL